MFNRRNKLLEVHFHVPKTLAVCWQRSGFSHTLIVKGIEYDKSQEKQNWEGEMRISLDMAKSLVRASRRRKVLGIYSKPQVTT